jgi:Alkylmercury lyase
LAQRTMVGWMVNRGRRRHRSRDRRTFGGGTAGNLHHDRSRLGLKLASDGDLPGMVRVEAFRQLLSSGSPVSLDRLASSIVCPTDNLTTALDELDRTGRIRRDENGRVVGSAGLSVIPDRHRIELDGRTFWTWCAYDILGIFGAHRASGSAFSRSPATGATLQLRFHDGRPNAEGVVLFRPLDSYAACCTNLYEEWCPNSNLFEDQTSAESWSTSRGLEGRIMGLEEASVRATSEWVPLRMGTALRSAGAASTASMED